ncbi:MAG TPA: FG-GAP-like repeat-containing protein [Clostridia bacterium]|nr:FG-GAP-like repeat-containing protein [Clostridia bacterium]
MREGKSFIKLSIMMMRLALAVALCAAISITPVFADISFNEQAANSIGYDVNDTAIGDFNNDGNIDLIIICTYDKYMGIFMGTGTGVFEAISSISTAAISYNPLKIATGDFDDDGNLDFAVTLEYGYNIAVYRGNGDGTFAEPTMVSFSNSKALGIASGDFNEDGHTDIVLGDQETSSSHKHFQMLTNNGLGGFTASGDIPNGGALYAFKLLAEDFDEDGNIDIAFLGDSSGYSGTGSFSMVYGDGAGGFGNGWSCDISRAATRAMDVADLNNDGLLDIIFPKSHTGTGVIFISTLTNQGGKTAFALNEFSSSSVYVDNFGIVAEDFNGDYEMDAVAAGENKLRFWLGISDYVFSEAPDTYITAANNPKILTAADFNKDGKVDIASVNSTNNTLSVYLNNCNFGPFVNAISDTRTGTEDQLDISINAADMYAGYSDMEGDSFGGIKITKVPVGGVLKLGESPAITDGQTFSPAELDGNAFVFNPNDNWHGDAFLEWRPLDAQGSVGITRRVNISIESVIDAPLNTVPAAQAVLEDTPLVFSTAVGNAIQVSDLEVEAAELLEASITTVQGTVTLNCTAGLTFTVGDGSADSSMTFSGTLTNINTALDGLTFYPAADYNGTATITINTNDQGNGGAGSTLSDEDTVNITVNFVNDAPLFTKGSDVTVNEDSGAQTVSGWATGISGGPGSDSGQNTAFIIANNTNPGLFSAGPAIDTYYGNLTFTPAANANGSAEVTIRLADDQGTANGGQNMSAPQTFNITVNAVNDAPTNTVPVAQSVNEDMVLIFSTADANFIQVSDPDAGMALIEVTLTATEGVLTLNGTTALSFDVGDGNEDSLMTFTGTLSDINTALNGLAFAPTAEYSGGASISINANDQGNTGAGGAFTDTDLINITVNIVNDAPSFIKGADQSVGEDCGAQTVTGWATGITAGPPNESGQTLEFIVTNDNNDLFSVQPAVAANGTMTYTPAADANGSAIVTVALTDNGGTANGGTDTTAFQTFVITVSAVNDAPSFAKGADQSVNEDCGAQTIAGWATGITAGPPNEEGQTLTFGVTNDNNGLFSVQPAVAADGTLTYTPAADSNGSATATLYLSDNGGTANGGTDTTGLQTLTITVSSINDAPSFTKGADQIVNEDSGTQTITGWATGITAGPSDEAGQSLIFNATNDNNGLFSVQPAVAVNGTLTYTPAADANGSATVTLYLSDNGGTANEGTDTSAVQTFTISINSMNDGSSFTKGADQIVNEDCGAQTVTGWATGITAGPPNESGQTLEFIVTNDNNGLFSVQPAMAANGTLTYTPAADANGSATVTVALTDNGGVDTTTPQTFIITVSSVNDTPSFTKGADQIVNEDCGAQTIAGWATGITAGPSNESGQILEFIVTNDNNGLFSVQPAVAVNGTLTYTPEADANGSATVSLCLSDNGGTGNGGVDTTTPQTLTITVSSVNDAPSFIKGADQIVNEDCGAQIVAGWATGITAGPSNESGQTLEFIVTNDNNDLFSVQPAVDINGTLTYTVADNTSGIAAVSVQLKDNGGGTDTSSAHTFIIKVCARSGSGEIALSQHTFTAGKTSSTITFTYTAASGGMEDGKLTIEVPDGWSSLSTVPTANGYTTVSTGIVSISGRTLLISDITVSSGDTISVTYGDKNGGGPGATAPTVKGLYEWTVKSAAMADGSLSSLVNSPKISVLPDITSATQSSILAGDNEIPADGQTTTTITAVLTDAYGNTIGDHTVSLSQGSGTSTILPSSTTTDSDGKAVFTVSSFRAGTVTYTAKDDTDNITLSDKAEVTFKPGIKYTNAAVNVEEGEAAEYTVSLISCPDSEVTVTAEVYGELDVSPVELIFDSDNWNIEQIFTLTAEDNSSKDGNRLQTVTNSVYSSDSLYDGLDFDITVNILDNDTPGVSIIQSSGYTEVGEDGSEDGYTVKLLTKPKGNVVVSANTDSQLTVEPPEIIFTAANWNIAQELTVTAVDDDMIEGTHSSTVSHTISSSDNDYDDIDISEITVAIADNDFPDDPSDDASLKSLEISQGTLIPGFDPVVTEYNVKVNNSIGSITITPTASESHGTITVNGTAVASSTTSYPITLSVGKNTINVKVTAQDGVTTETYVIDVVRASKQSNDDDDGPQSGGGGNAGNSGTPKENGSVQQPKTDSDGNVSITALPRLDSRKGTAAASLDADALENAFGMAETGTDGVRTVIFDIPGVEGANAYDCNLPTSFLTSGDSSRAVEIKTGIASVTVPGNILLQENSEGSRSISLIIASADKSKLDADAQNRIGDRPAVELYLMINGKKIPWSNNNAPVTVTIPYTPTAEELKDPEHITVWYIDSSGKVVSVPSGRYDPATGRVSFSTTHFSRYAVVYVQRTFSDIGGYAWARNQIEVLASKGIINGASEKTFSPQVNISRADYLVMLVKTLGLTADFDGNFVDVKPGDYYYEAAGIAKKLGIAAGDKDNRFDPREDITRQDMVVLTARALEISGSLKPAQKISAILDRFSDKAGIAGYAMESLATFVGENLITGSEGRLNPGGRTTRAEAAVLLYRIYNRYNN